MKESKIQFILQVGTGRIDGFYKGQDRRTLNLICAMWTEMFPNYLHIICTLDKGQNFRIPEEQRLQNHFKFEAPI